MSASRYCSGSEAGRRWSAPYAPATKWNVLQLIDCSALRSIPITETSPLLWLLLTSHSSLLLRLMRPSVRPPQLRCVLFPSIYLPHLPVLPAAFGLQCLLPPYLYFRALYAVPVRQARGLPTYSFFQIPPHGGHPCCSAMCFAVAYAHSGLASVRERPCWAIE